MMNLLGACTVALVNTFMIIIYAAVVQLGKFIEDTPVVLMHNNTQHNQFDYTLLISNCMHDQVDQVTINKYKTVATSITIASVSEIIENNKQSSIRTCNTPTLLIDVQYYWH